MCSSDLQAKLINGNTYNVGYENYSVLEIAQKIKKTLSDPSVEIEISDSNDLRSYKVSSKKIWKELGFKATHSVEDAVLDIQHAYKKGKFQNPLDNPSYYNIKMMQHYKLD